ncbi:MAG TPA: GNAT family N-acetyltransferase [Candidatus Limiplasma sp.]|nr:GNAT family N-acetyltransferase [Candidatus Limiplasma sp.]
MFTVHENTLSAAEYIDLYASVGWTPPLPKQVETALQHSDFTVCVWDNDRPIGMGRIIGDGAISYFVKDVAVRPEYQGRGAGRLMMNAILGYVRKTVPAGYHVCLELISSQGMEPFYEAFGFGKKPGNGMGHGMMALVIGEKPMPLQQQ